ncbi:hypothetical protein LF845_06095 [Deferribacterales bacterium Es71-Z0220]|uniref:hypothetical protein n=1 Tax=Deferrivibrio essentukiensis TaxID=2880922 RepID=UPI001F60D6F8|nr:hypothetical protein [Deferrivibrio essentukiensis]MCB4204528.1 hypothetical protein [Deferrivibrio essentukiensis]
MKTNWNLHAHIEKNNAYGKEVGFAKEDFKKHKQNFVHLKFSFNDLSFFKAGYTTKNDILKVLKNILNEFTEQIENGYSYTEKRRNGKQYARTLQITNFKIAAHLDKIDHPHLHFLFNKKEAKNLGNKYIQLRKLLANISKKYNLENISFENENYVNKNKYLKIKLENFFWQIIRNSESTPDFNVQNEIKKRFGNIENFENLLFNYVENYKNYSFINKLIKKINDLANEKLFDFIYEEQYFEILELIKQKDIEKLKNFSNSKLLREYIRYCYNFNYSKSYINFDHLNITKDVDFVSTLIKTIDFSTTTKTNNTNNKNKYSDIFKTLNIIVNYAINVSKNEKELLDNLNVNSNIKVKWHTKNSVKLGFTFIINNTKYVYTFNKSKYKNISNVRKVLKENNYNYVSALLTDGNIGNINNNINIEQLQKYYNLLTKIEKEEPIKAADYSLLFNNACINNFNNITQNKKITKQVYYKKIKELYAKRQQEMQKNFAYRKQNFSYKNIKNYIGNEKELKTEIFTYLFANKNKYKAKRY